MPRPIDHIQVSHAKEPTFGHGEHPAYPEGYKMVALLDVPEKWDGENTEYLAGYAFSKTNHVDGEWWDNEGVTRIGPPCRSTSVGDVVVLPDGRVLRYENAGFAEVTVENRRAS